MLLAVSNSVVETFGLVLNIQVVFVTVRDYKCSER
jgi:hypothetical protein